MLVNHQDSFPPIEDYGFIGNCHTAALVSSHGSIDWFCLPRFDSPSLFARILDLERGGAWSVQPSTSFRANHQYLVDTNILETTFTCDQGRVRVLDFIDITMGTADIANPAQGMLIRIVEGMEGAVEIRGTCAPRLDYGRKVPPFTPNGRQVRFGEFVLTGPDDWHIDTGNHALLCQTTVRTGERVAFTLAIQAHDEAQRVDTLVALEATTHFWRQWASKCTYEGPYRDAVVRSALTLKLLTDAPSGAIVAAPTTSLPEEIGGTRNWDYRFTWIRDASFTLYALLLAGYLDTDNPFFDWIVRAVKLRGTGIKILYPISSEDQVKEQVLEHLRGYRNSRPVRIGNAAVDQVQLDVYGEVVDALYFASRAGQYDPAPIWHHFRPIIDWVADHWQEPGNGIWEVRGGVRHFVYGKVMTWVALDRGIKLAEHHQLPADLERWRQERDRIRAEVLEKGWSDRLKAFKQSYEDERLDAANLLLPVVGFIDGSDPRIIATIDATLDQLVVNGLCYRYLDAPEGLSGNEATFVLCTFWLIDALILAKRVSEAQALFEQILRRASPLGLFAEEMDPATGAHLGNFPQAFSHIGVINAAVSFAHAGHAGSVQPHHAAAAHSSGVGGGGARTM